MNQTRKFFIYTRKSTDTEDRQVRSIADQLAQLRELAKKEHLEIVDVFVEKQTAKIPGRPIFGEMIARIEKGEASGILAWHPDRLARNSVDGGKVIYLVDTAKITDLKFPTFWFDSTPQGKFMLSIAFSQSKYYIDNLSENIKRGHRQKLKNGLWPQMAPLGYLNDKQTKNISVDKVKSVLIKKTFEAYATGNFTLAQLRKIINDLGLKGRRDGELSISNFQYLLKNPFYYGLIRYSGEFYEGKHEPIITKKLFDEAQEVMARKSKPKTKELKPYAYRGFFRCGECGCFITTETQKGHNYLRCTKRKNPCLQRYVREDAITSLIQTELQKVSLPDDWADWMTGELKKEKMETAQASELFAQNVKSEIVGVDEKLDKLMTAYLENALSLAEYQTAKNKLVNQKQSLKDKLTAFEQKVNNRFELATRFILQSKEAKILAKDENPQSLRDCFKKVGSNFLIQNRALSFTPRGAWRILAESTFGALRAPAERRSREATSSQNWDLDKMRKGQESNLQELSLARFPSEYLTIRYTLPFNFRTFKI